MNIKNILIPLDDSEKTFQSINAVKSFFSSDSCVIYLLHIVDNYDVKSTDTSDSGVCTQLSKDILTKGHSLISDYNVKEISLMGSHSSVATDILETITNKKIDLVVMTKTSKGFFDEVIIGSVTSGILKKSSVPVMVIP
ncbi:MAG: universal stress protein [Clostridium sp.]